jgi:hypothetical protein
MDRMIIIYYILKEIGCEFVDWFELAHEEAYWLAFVNTVISHRVRLRSVVSRPAVINVSRKTFQHGVTYFDTR